MRQFYYQIIHHDLGIAYYKMSISEKNKTTNNKTSQNKVQCNLDRETAMNCKCKFEFLTDKDVLPEKISARKSCCNKKI